MRLSAQLATQSGAFALALSLAACGQTDSAERAHAEGQDADPSVRQEGEVTRDTSTAKIVRKSSETGPLEQVPALETFTGEQIDPDPASGIYQKGRGSTARINLSGTGNAAAIRQADDTDDGADGASATIALGNDSALSTASTAYIDQRGSKGVVAINQQGDGNLSLGIQRANLDGSGTGAEQTHTLAGHDHRSEIIQRASATQADVTLSQGGDSIGLVLQSQTGAKASIAIKNGPGSRAKIMQVGGGRASGADADIDGANNETRISQRSDKGRQEAGVSQSGANSEVRVVQDGAQGNVASINQNGRDGKALVVQTESPANKAQIDQEGGSARSLRGTIEQTGAGGANAADIDQTGQTHSAAIKQSGAGGGSVAGIDQSTDGTDENEALVEQAVDAKSGTDTVDIDQGGSANSAQVRQRRASGGTGSKATITQPGMRGKATVAQDGPSLKAQIDQNGNANDSHISQTGSGGASEASVKTGGGTDNNTARIEQKRGGTIAGIDQVSPNNSARITQTNPRPASRTVEADIDQGGDVQNSARIEQSGPGAVRSASLTQSGRENDGQISQSGAGDGMTANVQMAGDRGTLRIRQIAQGSGGIQAELQQQGDDNEIAFEQRGSELGATVIQNGNGNAVDVTQSGSGYDVSITQNGDNNSFSISYSGPAEGGGGFSIVQNGGETRDEK